MTINCKGELIDLNLPKIMGILNITPDSFFDGGKYKDEKSILLQTKKMLEEGATFIDLGAYSSRPGAEVVSEEEELARILPIVELLTREFPQIVLSIDTFRSNIASKCLEAGAALINDISAGRIDHKMLPTIVKNRVPYIMMHMKGTPQTMQQETNYKELLTDILYYFSERVSTARALGIHDIIVDPGFGFAKTKEQNFELLQKLDLFQSLNLPILAGVSRKSMIYKTLETNAENALNGTTALNMIALSKGANILRVHDVKEAVECVKLYKNLNNYVPSS
ncbi:dihydropteroate synthase [Maribacter algarum]|uniref:Dihydropteroate synthase n=1 Tax=Maribacter algarum (ex Zhang et al. 2020) TaxID=2578118 RepID=A0A5S3PSE9_9FLAO|nr:dihydropteroate synthase [Maribacter algarum]TMM57935.1 dihydropteroate synthase [Maribacter algarum]